MHLTIDDADYIIVHCREDRRWAMTQYEAEDEAFERMEDAAARAIEVYWQRRYESVKVVILPPARRL